MNITTIATLLKAGLAVTMPALSGREFKQLMQLIGEK